MMTKDRVLVFKAALFTILAAACLVISAPGAIAKAPSPLPPSGGDDTEVVTVNGIVPIGGSMTDIAQNGDIYTAVGRNDPSPTGADQWIEVYRSQDGGSTFQLFGVLPGVAGSSEVLSSLELCEGVANRVYISYAHRAPGGFHVGNVAYADLGAPTPVTWTIQTVFTGSITNVGIGNITSDDDLFNSYFLYAVASYWQSDGYDIWFSRSTDQGATWSPRIKIASFSSGATPSASFMGFVGPQISVGFNGAVHVAFDDVPAVNGLNDRGVGYVSATNYAANASDWASSVTMIASPSDGIKQALSGVAGSTTGATVAVAYVGGSTQHVSASIDGGSTWLPANRVSFPNSFPASSYHNLGYNPTLNYFYLATVDRDGGVPPNRPTLRRALEGSVSSWAVIADFYSGFENDGYATAAPDPSHGGRMAMTWDTRDAQAPGHTIVFDAQWRADPGIPNQDPGFPVTLPTSGTTRSTSPAIANVNSDFYDEVIFSNVDGQVLVVSPVGAILPGWPQDVGSIPAQSPVAVGDLNGDGSMSIVQGTADGKVFCFDGNGVIQPGFPVDLGTAAATYLSIGAVGPPYSRWIVVSSGNRIARINYRGVVQFLSGTLDGQYASTPAIGDVDNDGQAEIVVNFQYVGGGSGVYVIDGTFSTGLEAFRFFPDTASDAVTLANLDGDPMLEICHPTSGGTLYAMENDLSDMPGFPFSNGTGAALTSAALGQVLGTSTPELSFASRDARVHLLAATGTQQSSYPANTDSSWWLYGAPVMGQFLDSFNYVFVGSRDQRGYAFQNVFATSPAGWPKSLVGTIHTSPALGDIDKDGDLEIVYVSDSQVAVLDANTPQGSLAWPMYAFDSQRTGCSNCAEDIVTAIGDDAPSATTVSFRLASRNPSSSSMLFAAQIPVDATVSFQVLDLRGRRVRSYSPQTLSPGRQILRFDGRDDRGHRLARGQYFARIHVVGPSIDKVLDQRFVLID